jgi:hypothetical protein
MNPTDKCRRLAGAVLACIRKPITIDSRTQHYIDACLPGLSIEEVAHRICDAPDLDAASLMDLIFSPDEILQARLEPLLESETYGPDDEAAVVALLESETIETTLQGPEGQAAVPLRVPSSSLAAFVRRLGLSWRIPPGLAATLTQIHSEKTAIRLKVMLRNTRIILTGPATDFLEAFILGMAPGAEDFDACFRMTLELLGELGAETDPFRLLRIKTDALYKARDAAMEFENLLQRNNMETLMHRGVRAPEIGITAAEEKIALIDRIGRAVALGGVKAKRSREIGSTDDGQPETENGPLLPG